MYKKKSINNYIVQLPNNHKGILFSKKKYKLEEKCLVQISHQKKPNKIKCRDILILDGTYFTLSTSKNKNKDINYADNIYNYRSKYPYLFIYPKISLENCRSQFLIDEIKFLINKYLQIINMLVTNEEKKIYDFYTPSNFFSANSNIKSDDLIFVHNEKLRDELTKANIVKKLNLSKKVITLSRKEILYFNDLFLNYVESDLKNITYMDNGLISIESTEAFIAVDVNYSLYGSLVDENNIEHINFLAALKIFESIQLYKLSGLIIIDFIGRVNSRLDIKIRNLFFNIFNEQNKSSIVGPSPNGIYEITIERESFDIFYLKKIFS